MVIPAPRTSADNPPEVLAYPDGLDDAGRAHAASFTPDATERTYEAGYRSWKRYCADRSLPWQHARIGSLTAFVHQRWEDGRAPETIKTYLSGIAVRLRRDGHPVEAADVTAARRLVDAYARRAAEDGAADRGRGQAPALALGELRAIVAEMDLTTLDGLRDRMVFCLGFALAARSHELAYLRVGDVREAEEGLVVGVRVSKTGRRTVRVAYGSNPVTCPVRAWQAWRRACGWVPMLDGTEAAVQRIHRSGALHGQMSAKSVRAIYRRRAAAAGLELVRSHSGRAGFCTAARTAGKDTKAICDVSGHSPKSGQVYTYFRDPDGWKPENNATMGIGL
ncbi:tyrosine-type recombinase/integrase [Streptomyces sp. NPDC102364]|uniref:tyrosine-type recombinase/integrase n=1 Tax=Streptomyces sp. NPDC102364 TaxID=3366161 RepID=UPI0037F9F5AB